MEKLHFDSDYMRGCHPMVLKRLCDTNMEQTPGYGTDKYTANAVRLILEECGCPGGDVFFLVGGTQTNATVIDSLLRKYQGVLCTDTAHINVHEAGAIEATGHKVITLPGHEGKINAQELEGYITAFYADETYPHMVYPGMVYISYPTEYGTLYNLHELKEIRRICDKFGILLYMDGARLGYGLAARPEITLKDIAALCDVFYIGGTKVGCLFGEAVVIPRGNLINPAIPQLKQHGALLAKGRLLGIQFETLFTHGMYLKISRNAIDTAIQLKKGFIAKGYAPFIDSPTNQQFFSLPNEVIEKLRKTASFELWGPEGEKTSVVRFVTDWATSPTEIDRLLSQLPENTE